MTSALLDLASSVLQEYGKRPDQVSLIQSGGIKTVWKILAKGETFCLKRLRHNKERAMFSIYAQKHMAAQGARVPQIFPSLNNEDYVEYQGYLFVLYEWIEGRNLTLSRDLSSALEGLAQFHLDSAGYVPPPDCRVSSKLGRLGHYYASVIKRFSEWEKTAQSNRQNPLCQAFLKEVPGMSRLGLECIDLLEKSAYPSWVEEIKQRGNLCHQDYGDGNAILTPKGVYVLDLDGVTFDLPSRDLRKVIIKMMSNRNSWDIKLLKDMLNWYEKINPLNEDKRRVLYIDLLFPHELHDTAKNYFKKNKSINASAITRASALVRKKSEILSGLI
ncbi:MAG: CotS family spore coat protein [Bacillota bacterium]